MLKKILRNTKNQDMLNQFRLKEEEVEEAEEEIEDVDEVEEHQ